jgi:hypothetical protein
MESVILQPEYGRYSHGLGSGPGGWPSAGEGTPMTGPQLAQCLDSDDDRFGHSWADWDRYYGPYAKLAVLFMNWRFDASAYMDTEIEKLQGRWEGYSWFEQPPPQTVYTDLWMWNWPGSNWEGTLPWGSKTTTGPPDFTIDGANSVPVSELFSPLGYAWLLIRTMVQWPLFNHELQQWTDQIYLELFFPPAPPARISEDLNVFGQRFRAFDDNEAAAVACQSLDVPAGDWSPVIEPFGGSSKPSIECLPDGRLRAAYVDAGGAVAKAQSFDDGETWEAT